MLKKVILGGQTDVDILGIQPSKIKDAYFKDIYKIVVDN